MMDIDIEQCVREWLQETRALFQAGEVLATWLTASEHNCGEGEIIARSLALPRQNLGLIEQWLVAGEQVPTRVSHWNAERPSVSPDVAKAIVPLFERIAHYQPEYIEGVWVVGGLEEKEPRFAKLGRLYRQFVGNFGTYVWLPVAEAHPTVVDEWMALGLQAEE